MQARCFSLAFICFIVFSYLALPIKVQAQEAGLSRNLEPVVLRGDMLPGLTGIQVSEVFVYAYDGTGGSWSQIPFQIDEVGSNGQGSASFFIADDGLWDEDDELVFMAMDAGDRADSVWIDDLSSQAFDRYEIEVLNPLAAEERAWVYVYRSTTLTFDAGVADYVDWFASQTDSPGEDLVRSRFYEMQHARNGFPKDLSITAEGGGSGQDLIDLLKLRALLDLPFPFSDIPITENQIQFIAAENDSVRILDGRIRVIREIEASLVPAAFIGPLAFSTPPLFYYPYSHAFDIEIPELPEVAGLSLSINSGRLSIDLNANAAGMTFVSANNPAPGFPVDGAPDSPVLTIDNVLPDGNWIFIGGQQGTIVHLFPISTAVGGARALYYRDNSSNDDNDTGDRQSFADTGIELLDGVTPPVLFRYRGYFLAGGQSSEVGARVATFETNPLQNMSQAQSFGAVTSVRTVDGAHRPAAFALFANYPNPFNPSTEIRYQLATASSTPTTLRVYNLLGQEIRTLVNERQPAGLYAVVWDGNDTFGRAVSSGVYIYRLEVDGFVESRKMLLVK